MPAPYRAVASGVLAAALLALPLSAAAAPAAAVPASSIAQRAAVTPRGEWQWPLTGSPAVARTFEAPAQRWSPGHRGVDLAADPGTAVIAPTDGVVAFAGTVVGRPVLSIATPGARVTLEPVAARVAVGQRVARGQVVGTLAPGSVHCATPCLHWGVRVGRDHYLDPLVVLARGARAAPPVLLPVGAEGAGTRRRPIAAPSSPAPAARAHGR